ncbi:hypothetical protein O2N63_08430 [Aliiroseovarius sp. KMU-50]|uniref:Dihydroorotate dehydrogenase n=1 Tax=Aliiroseovarius salicola TaxID=3009082 RepID=A0ABT4W0T5_9RHOB|nr:hypothetical protein [Aliiroseovarius sp. KMU-50]MDA5094115.1 hypothetical protein [Aliiroseovarius sp. KMU-50]
MAKTDKDILDDAKLDTELEAFFEAGCAASPVPSDALMAAIVEDAQTHQPTSQTVAAPAQRRSFWREFLSQIGGWPSVAGMATATIAGVWIGFADPVQLETWSGGVVLSGNYDGAETIYSTEDLAPSYFGTSLIIEEEG